MVLSSFHDKRFVYACLVLALAIYALRLVSGADALGIIAFCLFLLAAFSVGFNLFIEIELQSFLTKLFLLALAVRMVVAIVIAANPNLAEPDTMGYSDRGWKIAEALRNGLGFLPDAGVGQDPGYYYLNGIVFALLGHHPIALGILNSFLGAALIVPIYLWGLDLSIPSSALRKGAVLIGFWPSLVYFTAQNLKDAVILILLAVILLTLGRLNSLSIGRGLIVISIAVLLLGLFRIFIMPAVVAVVMVTLVWSLKDKQGWWGTVVIVLVGVALLVTAFQTVFAEKYSSAPGSWPSIESLLASRNGGARGATALPVVEPTVHAVVSYLPVGLAYYFAGPFLWIPPASFRQWFIVPEMIVWYIFLPLAVIGVWQALRNPSKQGIVIFLLYFLLFSIGTALMTANMGTMYRIRFDAWVFAFMLAVWGLTWLWKRFKFGEE